MKFSYPNTECSIINLSVWESNWCYNEIEINFILKNKKKRKLYILQLQPNCFVLFFYSHSSKWWYHFPPGLSSAGTREKILILTHSSKLSWTSNSCCLLRRKRNKTGTFLVLLFLNEGKSHVAFVSIDS